MNYIILYYIILHYILLYYIILNYIVLYYIILYYIILYYIILYYIRIILANMLLTYSVHQGLNVVPFVFWTSIFFSFAFVTFSRENLTGFSCRRPPKTATVFRLLEARIEPQRCDHAEKTQLNHQHKRKHHCWQTRWLH